MLSEPRVRELLEPFGLSLSSGQVAQLLAYLDLLLRWNRTINLTAVRNPETCVTRHFGESLFLVRWAKLRGKLLDIGSGAGFPGLALKIVFPEIQVTLLEPATRKRAFLKEVARTCSMESVEVRRERLEEFVRCSPPESFGTATARAVGSLDKLVPLACRVLKRDGRLALWISRSQARSLSASGALVSWTAQVPLPLSSEREIWVGAKRLPAGER